MDQELKIKNDANDILGQQQRAKAKRNVLQREEEKRAQ